MVATRNRRVSTDARGKAPKPGGLAQAKILTTDDTDFTDKADEAVLDGHKRRKRHKTILPDSVPLVPYVAIGWARYPCNP